MIYTVEEAVAAIEAGHIIVLKTDTVLGMITDGGNRESVERLYELKDRTKDKSAVVFVQDVAAVASYVKIVPPYAEAFMRAFWPGALTLVFHAKGQTEAPAYLADPTSIALRMPHEEHVLALLQKTSKTLISTSANRSGESPFQTLAEAQVAFGDTLVYWEYDADNGASGVASTVVDVRNPAGWEILREGVITKEMLWAVLDK